MPLRIRGWPQAATSGKTPPILYKQEVAGSSPAGSTAVRDFRLRAARGGLASRGTCGCTGRDNAFYDGDSLTMHLLTRGRALAALVLALAALIAVTPVLATASDPGAVAAKKK